MIQLGDHALMSHGVLIGENGEEGRGALNSAKTPIAEINLLYLKCRIPQGNP
jgi:hypothetical protein